jgi:hypothetical protein
VKAEHILRGVAVVAVALAVCVGASRAQHAGHAEFHDVYQTWCQPGHEKPCHRVNSCCDARKLANGEVEGDCYATEFRLIDGRQWQAKLDEHDAARLQREWIDVPDAVLLREKNPDSTGTRGHVCVWQYGDKVLCAVPPTGAM